MRNLIWLAAACLFQADAEAASRAEAQRVQAALAHYAGDVHGCYGRALAPDQDAAGEVLVRLTLGEDERVERAEILEDGVGSPILSACLTERMVAWNLPGLGAAGTQVVFPLVFQGGGPQYSVRLADVESVPKAPEVKEGKPPRILPLQTWLLLDEKSVGVKRAALAVIQVGPKFKVATHRHPQSAELLYVIDGHGRLLIPGEEPEKLEPGTAVYIKPGQDHSVDDQSPQKPLKLLQLFAPPGPERVLRDRKQTGGTEVVKGRTAPHKADGSTPGYKVIKESEVPPNVILGGRGKAWILLEQAMTGDEKAYLGLLDAQAGAKVPTHQHKGASELLYILQGKGKLQIGGRDIPFEEGTALYIPEDTDHQATITEAVRAVQIYAPAGAEQRFRQTPTAGPTKK